MDNHTESQIGRVKEANNSVGKFTTANKLILLAKIGLGKYAKQHDCIFRKLGTEIVSRCNR